MILSLSTPTPTPSGDQRAVVRTRSPVRVGHGMLRELSHMGAGRGLPRGRSDSESTRSEGREVSRARRPAITLLALLTVTLATTGCGYNTLVADKEAIDAQWSQVLNQLQRRNDLIPNLVEVTKGYASHEKSVFEAIANARSKLIGAQGRDQQIAAANEVSSALSRLLAISEAYPQLKADAQFTRLSDELAGTENRIATERRRYNEIVQAYNTSVKSFPTMLYASMLGFTPAAYFEVPKEAQAAPKVSF